MHPGSV